MCYSTQTQTFSPTKHTLNQKNSVTLWLWDEHELLVLLFQVAHSTYLVASWHQVLENLHPLADPLPSHLLNTQDEVNTE